jgi:hypothetical protein
LERLRLVPFLLATALLALDLDLDFLRLLTALTTLTTFLALDLDLDFLRLLTALTTFLTFLDLLIDFDLLRLLLEPVFLALALALDLDFDLFLLLTGVAFLALDADFLLLFLAPPARAAFEPRFSNSLADIYNYKYTLYYFINKNIISHPVLIK